MSQQDQNGSHVPGGGDSRAPDASGTARRDLAGLAIAAAILFLAVMIGQDASGYVQRQNYAQFGPEIFPYIIGAGLLALGLLTVPMALKGDFPERPAMNVGAVVWIVGALVLMVTGLYLGLGFILSAAALFGCAARGLGRKPLVLTYLIGVAFSTVLYLLFQYGLGLTLPGAAVEDMLNSLFQA